MDDSYAKSDENRIFNHEFCFVKEILLSSM